jgi:MFS superfamily sulfate permease-like transporter
MITIIILIIVTTTIIILPSSVVLIMVGILIALIWLINNEYKYRNKNENRIKQRLSSDSSQINQIEIKQKPRGWLDWEKSPHMRYVKRITRYISQKIIIRFRRFRCRWWLSTT